MNATSRKYTCNPAKTSENTLVSATISSEAGTRKRSCGPIGTWNASRAKTSTTRFGMNMYSVEPTQMSGSAALGKYTFAAMPPPTIERTASVMVEEKNDHEMRPDREN